MIRSREREPENIKATKSKDARSRTSDAAVDTEDKQDFESGYSEADQAKDIEFRSGDLSSLKKSKGFQNLQSSAKTLTAYQMISQQLSALIESYTELIEKDLHQAQKMRDEITKMRSMQKILLTKLFGKLEEEFPNKELLEDELKPFLQD